jgi:DNA-binding transcriptional LysR family regulator
MNLRQIEVFRAVMLTGGLSDAARMLNVTQPGLSRAIKHLELQLNIKLFERIKGRLVATAEARELFEQIQRVYKGIQGVQSFALSLSGGATSTLRIVCSPSVGLDLVPRVISSLLKSTPNARFELEILPSPQLIDALLTGDADVGICAASIDHPLLRINTIGRMKMVCAAPLGSGLTKKSHATLSDMLKLPFIAFEQHTFQGKLVALAFQKAKKEFTPVVTVRFARTACSLVAAGAGVSIVDELTVANMAHGTIETYLIEPQLQIPISAITPLHRPIGTLTARFLKIVDSTLHTALTQKSKGGKS